MKKNRPLINNSSGQSLFEVIVALAVITLIIVALVAQAVLVIRNANFSKEKSRATTYAQYATEWLRGQRDTDVETFKTRTNVPVRCLNSLNWSSTDHCGTNSFISDTRFKRELRLTQSLVDGKTVIKADVRVFWSSSQGVHEVRSVTEFTDWRER